MGTCTSRAKLAVAFFLGLANLVVASCVVEGRELGAQCDLTSDCQRPFVCRLERCRNECAEDRDCPVGAICVSDNDGLGSCLLPDESSCSDDAACPAELRCAPDSVCRRACVDESVCLRSQVCVDGFCEQPDGPTDGGPGRDATLDGGPDTMDGGGACDPPRFDCNDDPADGCETDTDTDVLNCGGCAIVCRDTGVDASPACVAGACALTCDSGFGDCNADLGLDGCETRTSNDEANCGACGRPCGPSQVCIMGACRARGFPSGGTTPFEPMGSMSVPPGDLEATSILIPAGVTIATSVGTGFLELIASGDVVIDGTLDVSGGNGARTITITSSQGGGATGAPIDADNLRGCGTPGPGGDGMAGQDGPGAPAGCALGGLFGGGMSGVRDAGGGGGGGHAGGGGGGSASGEGGRGGSTGADVGGLGGAMCSGGGGGQAPGSYAGEDGGGDCATDPFNGGGGGGSIGATAAADLAVATTFRPGSGGGGAGASASGTGGGGGGGGGGALRVASGTRIRITGSILANGGDGGGLPSSSAGGGGGSGGVVYLAAPELEMTATATIDVAGGRGGGVLGHEGGDGGLGRVRISTDPSACTLRGNFGASIPRPADCSLTATPRPNEVYIGLYPD